MATAKLFKNGQSQAVRLPKAFRGRAGLLKKVGNTVLLTPYDDPWQLMLDSLDKFEGDLFPNGREQPEAAEQRESLDQVLYLLGTNICVYMIRGRQRRVVERFQQPALSDLLISSATTAELYFGIEKSERRKHNLGVLETFLLPIAVQPFAYETSVLCGRLRADLERRITPIGPLDTLVAAHALSLGAVLVTNNTREFERVPELRLEDWATA